MNYRIIFFLVLLAMPIAHAQTPKIDSLNRLISRAKTDTARINQINQKIALLSEINIDSSLSLSLRTIREAQRIRYKRGEAYARLFAAQNYNYKGNYAAVKSELNALEPISLALNDSTLLLKVYNTYGMMYGMQSKYDTSITFFEKSAVLAKQMGNHRLEGTLYTNIGISYQMLSNLPQALRYQQMALDMAEADRNINSQAYALVNLANTYKLMGDLKGAEQRFYQAIKLAKQDGIRNVELYAYTNLAGMFSGGGPTAPKGYDFAMKAARLGHEMGDQGIEATSLSRAATNLSHLKRYTEAEALAKKAITIANASRQPLNIHQTYSAMGSILKRQAKFASAIPFYEKSFAVMKETDIYDEQTQEVYAELADCYEKTGQYRQALATFKTASTISDSIRSKENVQKGTELKMTYEFEKKQQLARAEQQKQNELARNRQRTLGAGLGLTLVLAGVSFYAFRTKQKANTLLEQQKEELQTALTQLQSTQMQLVQAEKMASLGELTAGIAHEIQNPLNFVNNFSELSVELADELKEELGKEPIDKEYITGLIDDLSQNQQKINHHGKRADSIVKNMLEHSRASSGEKQPTDLNALADEYFRLAYHGLRAKDKDFQAELLTDFDAKTGSIELVPQDIGRVLLNLYNNAFYAVRERQKSGQPGYVPQVRVQTKRQPAGVEIRVNDNGVGIPDNVQQKIFQPFFTTKPTGQGTGLGLSLSYDIITKGHHGAFEVESQPGEGTQMIIKLPG
ncbi:tetratricopeptide repeat protein [Larkinella sp. VNQ87]|uniref:tetratricopeptide repeat protein n=1 Tax=Larkinella sp. VNQ87 TaxID=3400921 RepID=UPI003C08B02C